MCRQLLFYNFAKNQDKYGMIVKKGNDELKEEINKVLERMINDGTIDKLVLKHSKQRLI